ncbi:MAG: hypothetical protein ABIM99_02305 [Candidatus Dojkabacteria bacterium]
MPPSEELGLQLTGISWLGEKSYKMLNSILGTDEILESIKADATFIQRLPVAALAWFKADKQRRTAIALAYAKTNREYDPTTYVVAAMGSTLSRTFNIIERFTRQQKDDDASEITLEDIKKAMENLFYEGILPSQSLDPNNAIISESPFPGLELEG